MKRVPGVIVAVVASVCMLTAFDAPRALAAEQGFNIITSPLPIKLSTDPGRTVQTELRVKNQNPTTERIKVGLMRFGAEGESGQPNLFELSDADRFAQWVTFTPSVFDAPPNTWMTVKMTIDVPADAALGYYMAVTFSRATDIQTGEGSSVRGSAATLVLLDVRTDGATRELELVEFKTNRKLYEYLPVDFSVKVKNKGNIYLVPSGNIFITKDDKPVSTLVFNGVGGSVLPESNRVYNLPWDDGFPRFEQKLVDGKPVNDENAVPKRDLTYNFSDASKFRFGKYTAKLLVVYDDGQRDVPVESTISFWVLPWKMMLLGLVVLLLIGFGLWSVGRSTFRKVMGGVRKRRGNA